MRKFGSTFKGYGARRGGDLTVYINMAPMIDFLIMVIAYLLVSASFCSVGLIHSVVQSTPALKQTTGQGPIDPTTKIDLYIQANHAVQASYQLPTGSSVASVTTETYFSTTEKAVLISRIQSISQGNSKLSITINADNTISFDEVIRLLNQISAVTPNVSLNVGTR